MSSTHSALVVGLGGVTNGGKTTMCRSLERLFSSDKYNLRVMSMHLDHYFRSPDDPHHVHLDEYDHHDWDSLNALDTDRFLVDIESNRSKCDLLLIEGFLIYNIPHSSNQRKDLFDLMYYFDLPYAECLRRREGRNYDPPDPKGYFQGHVWQAYTKAKEETFQQFKENKLVVVDTTKESFEKIEKNIVKDIEKAFSNQ
jgi:nicotinamide/nicotinate riboside kinase